VVTVGAIAALDFAGLRGRLSEYFSMVPPQRKPTTSRAAAGAPPTSHPVGLETIAL